MNSSVYRDFVFVFDFDFVIFVLLACIKPLSKGYILRGQGHYWIIIQDRWMIDDNFNKGPRVFFESVPMPFRLLVVAMVRRTIKRNLWGHGLGRHSSAEIEQVAVRDLEAISRILGDKPWLMGTRPCGADATVWSFVASALCQLFQASTLRAEQNFPNLAAYVKLGMDLWFPELAA